MGTWIELLVFRDSRLQSVHPRSVVDPNLRFATKEEAEAAGDAMARHWCSENYPDLPVRPVEQRRPEKPKGRRCRAERVKGSRDSCPKPPVSVD